MGQVLLLGSLKEAIARGDDIAIGDFDLKGVTPFGNFVDIPDQMPFEGVIEDIMFSNTQANEMVPDGKGGTMRARSWLWTIKSTEPGFEGATRTMLGRVPDLSEKGQKALKTLRTAAESAGYEPSQIDVGMLAYVGSMFLNSKVYCVNHHKVVNLPNGTTARDFDGMDFLTPEKYAERKAAIAKNGLGPQPHANLPRASKADREAAQGARGGGSGQSAAVGGGGPATLTRGPNAAGAGAARTETPANSGGAPTLKKRNLQAELES